MRWIDKYNKEKARKYKEEHSKITIKQLNKLFIKYMKRRGLFGKYISLIYAVVGERIWDKNFFNTMTNISRYSMYLNENNIKRIYGQWDDWVRMNGLLVDLEYYTYDNIIDKNHMNQLNMRNLVEKETDGFIKYLKENGYYRYILILFPPNSIE